MNKDSHFYIISHAVPLKEILCMEESAWVILVQTYMYIFQLVLGKFSNVHFTDYCSHARRVRMVEDMLAEEGVEGVK